MKLKSENENLNSVYKDIAEMLDIESARKIFEEYRGQQITFPVEFYSKRYIYAQIADEYNGSNIKQLATKYEYSERTIRRILKEFELKANSK